MPPPLLLCVSLLLLVPPVPWGGGVGTATRVFPPPGEKLRDDATTLSRTMRDRIRHCQPPPPTLRLSILAPVLPPSDPPPNLGAAKKQLHQFQRLLQALPPTPLTQQLLSDLDNLYSLLQLMEVLQGCGDPPGPGPPPNQQRDPPQMEPELKELLEGAPHTVAAVALGRMRTWLDGVEGGLQGGVGC
uniref:Leptin n=1 Tax=Coturnix japonica TaxID=93934 RepID=A0A6M3Z519_COTJA|nr:leptin [Coturnix japonica]